MIKPFSYNQILTPCNLASCNLPISRSISRFLCAIIMLKPSLLKQPNFVWKLLNLKNTNYLLIICINLTIVRLLKLKNTFISKLTCVYLLVLRDNANSRCRWPEWILWPVRCAIPGWLVEVGIVVVPWAYYLQTPWVTRLCPQTQHSSHSCSVLK